jgi:hypothetical protein
VFLGLGGGDAGELPEPVQPDGRKGEVHLAGRSWSTRRCCRHAALPSGFSSAPVVGGVADAWDSPEVEGVGQGLPGGLPCDKRFASPSPLRHRTTTTPSTQ